jgi:hypothetical protein
MEILLGCAFAAELPPPFCWSPIESDVRADGAQYNFKLGSCSIAGVLGTDKQLLARE